MDPINDDNKNNESNEETVSFDDINISDEDFMNLPEPDFSNMKEEEPTNEEGPKEGDTSGTANEDNDLPGEEVDPKVPVVEKEKEDDNKDLEPEKDLDLLIDPDTKPEKDVKVDEGDPAPKEDVKDTANYKELYENILKPFKANGQQVVPKSPEDLIRMAQMGANYHDKMAGMKPARTALKTLEKNDLLDPDKLSFLIDVSKGNPEAITKLLKEHNINPLDVDTKAESTYVQTDHTATEAEVELDRILKDVQSTPTGDTTLNIVANQWDETSRQMITAHPQILEVINEHMETGIYTPIAEEVAYRRKLGGLTGISDIDAYKQIGNELDAKGVLTPATPKEAVKTVVAPVIDPIKEEARLKKKKAASPNKAKKSVAKKVPDNFNPLDLSDEDFDKFDPTLIGLR